MKRKPKWITDWEKMIKRINDQLDKSRKQFLRKKIEKILSQHPELKKPPTP